MHYFYTILLSLFLYSQASAQGSLTALDAKNGFRNAKFGMKAADFEGLTLDPDKYGVIDEAVEIYHATSDALQIGDIPLHSISYVFFRGVLYRISIEIDPGVKTEVLNTMIRAYGNPAVTKTKSGFIDRTWTGKKVRMLMNGERYGIPGAYHPYDTIEIEYIPLMNQYLAYSKKKEAEATRNKEKSRIDDL